MQPRHSPIAANVKEALEVLMLRGSALESLDPQRCDHECTTPKEAMFGVLDQGETRRYITYLLLFAHWGATGHFLLEAEEASSICHLARLRFHRISLCMLQNRTFGFFF